MSKRDALWLLQGEDEIRIRRDRHGVPHVHCNNEADLYRGMGYCHARDRGLQMLVLRTLAQGRACERLRDTEEMLAVDRFFRRMNFGRAVEDEAARLSPEAACLIEAYADGVNRALARRRPWELRLLRHPVEPWTVADSMLLSRMTGYVALAQSQGDMERLMLEMLQAGVSGPHLEELFPGLLDGLDLDLASKVRLGERLVPQGVRWGNAVVRAMASNNWVLSGSKTTTGHALLANDPHLEANRLPAIWCELVLELGDRYCIASTMPGLPGVLVGRTNELAWGATYTFMDAVDSWIEDCRDGRYRRDIDGHEHWQPFRERREVIRRKRHPDRTEVFRENEHGVLDGDPHEPGLYLASRWSGAEAGSATLTAIQGMLHATSVAEGMDLLGRIETAWNWVLADRAGDIGYQMSGLMPQRRAGWNGFVPAEGWDPENDWRGFTQPADLPRLLNPECGFIATANNDLNHLGKVRPINLPMASDRADRIEQLLASGDRWNTVGVRAMQMDLYSLHAERILEILEPLLPDTDNGRAVRGWDRRYDTDSVGAFLFEEFYRALVVEVFGGVCGGEVARFLVEDSEMLTAFYANFDGVLLDPASRWYGGEGRDALWKRVAQRALDVAPARWGSRQRIVMGHMLFGGRLPLAWGFDHGPVELRGGRATIHQGQCYRLAGRATCFAPSFRFVTDMGEDAAFTCLAGGPSDRRFSRWYTSGLADWIEGRFKRLAPERFMEEEE